FGERYIFQALSIHSEMPDLILLIGLCAGITLTLVRHVLVTILNLEMNTKILAWITPLAAAACTPLYVVLIRSSGADGAALAFLLATAVQTLVFGWYVPASLRPVPTSRFFVALISSTAAAGVLQWFFGRLGFWSFWGGSLLSCILLLVLAYRLGALTTDERITLSRLVRIRVLRGLPDRC
ncbi:MAG: polysaccharide biosynthesis C-terminal domain-containing protein, partial [Limisphaerales bacterium]